MAPRSAPRPGTTRAARGAPGAPGARADFVASLAKGLDILSLFAQGDLYGNQQLVEMTGLPKATVSRFTSTLVDLGYLRQDDSTRRFSMGTRLLGMGASVQRNIGLQRAARPLMEALSEQTDMSVGLGTRDRMGIVFLELVRPRLNRLVVNSDVGTVLPLESTAIGLGYLVGAPVRERTRLLEGLQARHGDAWPTIRTVIERAHADHARLGFVTAQRSWGRDVSGVAVPLQVPGRGGLFVFNCMGAAHQLSARHLRTVLGPGLVAMVAEVRRRMREQPQERLNPPTVHEP
jgi:DNA-binding IclR family transcriptional regulator